MRNHLRALGPLLGALVLLACSSDDPSASPDASTPAEGESGLGPSGHFFGPVGSKLDLSIGADTVTPSIAAASAPSRGYGSTRFDFREALAGGASYSVTAGAAPENQTCRIYQGQDGGAPIAEGALRAGCEWTFDLVSRSTDDTVTSGADYSSFPAVGGADVPIGSSEARGEGRFVAFKSRMIGLAGTSPRRTTSFGAIGSRARLASSARGPTERKATVRATNRRSRPMVSRWRSAPMRRTWSSTTPTT